MTQLNDNRPPEIQRMLPRHFAILNLVLAGNGPKEIAQALGMTPQAISLIMNSPIFQHEVSRRRDGIDKVVDQELASAPIRAKQILEENAAAAAQVHIDIIENEVDPRVRQASANSILDRVFGDGKKMTQANVIVLEAGAILNLQAALAESAEGRKKFIDAKDKESEVVVGA